MMNLSIRELTEREWNDWDAWLMQQAWGSPFSSSWWLASSCSALGGSPLILAAFDGPRLIAGMSLRVAAMGPLRLVRPSPLYNPVILPDGSSRRRLLVLGALLDAIVQRRLIVPSLTCTPDTVDVRAAAWREWSVLPEWTVVNTLPGWSLEASCTRSLRMNVRKAGDAGITAAVEHPDAALLAGLMEMSMQRHGEGGRMTGRQLNTFMEAAADRALFVVARAADGVPVSAVCYMWNSRETAFALWGGSSPGGLSAGACSLAYATGLSELRRRGFQRIDWCGGNLPGVSDYKLEFGGDLVTRLCIAREPAWFRFMFAEYVRAATAAATIRKSRNRPVPAETGEQNPA